MISFQLAILSGFFAARLYAQVPEPPPSLSDHEIRPNHVLDEQSEPDANVSSAASTDHRSQENHLNSKEGLKSDPNPDKLGLRDKTPQEISNKENSHQESSQEKKTFVTNTESPKKQTAGRVQKSVSAESNVTQNETTGGESLVFEKAKVGEKNSLGVVVANEPVGPGQTLKHWMSAAGEFYQTFEEWMGWDETSRLQKLEKKCKEADAGSCFNIAVTRHREGKLFEAENWYHVSCSLMHQLSCDRYKKLVSKREAYEANLVEERLLAEGTCESGIGSWCARAAYIAAYFGEIDLSDKFNQKACKLGYPAGCLQLARKEFKRGNLEASKELDKKAKFLLMQSH